jgi:P-type Cu+ transporter
MPVRDPVCGKRINRNKAHITIEYRGEEFHLCCATCQATFERDPEEYASHRDARAASRRRT